MAASNGNVNGTLAESSTNANVKISTEPDEEIHYEFSSTVMGQLIPFDVIQFGKAVIIMIGPGFADLSVAIRTPYDRTGPTSTKLVGSVGDTFSTSLAAKLTAKLKKPVYVSYNVPTIDPNTTDQIEACVFEALRQHPERF